MKLLSTAKIQKVVDQAGTNNVEGNMFLTYHVAGNPY
jgi:hypothetical protein